MKHIIFIAIFLFMPVQEKITIFDFKQEGSEKGWYIVNDGVMGGLSQGQFSTQNEVGVFKGLVSTDNNGGFTMVQNRFDTLLTNKYTAFVLKLKGDGKNYQFRVKSDKYDRHSYVYQFSTNGEWQEIVIPFSSLVPRFRGRSMDLPNFDGSQIEELAFLIGNKRDEAFELQIRKIQAE